MSKRMEDVVDIVRRGSRSRKAGYDFNRSRMRCSDAAVAGPVVPFETPAETRSAPIGVNCAVQLQPSTCAETSVVPIASLSAGGSYVVQRQTYADKRVGAGQVADASLVLHEQSTASSHQRRSTSTALVLHEQSTASSHQRRSTSTAQARRGRSVKSRSPKGPSDLVGFIVQGPEEDGDADYIPEEESSDCDGDDDELEETESSGDDDDEDTDADDDKEGLSMSDSDANYEIDLELLDRSAPLKRRKREPDLQAELQADDEEMIDPEEALDQECSRDYQPLDLNSFGGHEALRAASIASAQLPAAQLQPETEPDPFEGKWGDLSFAPKPGERGFNLFAAGRLRSAISGKDANSSLDVSCPPLQPHQKSVAFLLHPSSPVKRLLVDHPTGSGKTREIVTVLHGLFFDPRPKVPIFPTQTICRNFYIELLRWPSRYRDYFCCVCPGGAYLASGDPVWRMVRCEEWNLGRLPEVSVRALARSCQEVLEMRGAFFEGQMRPGVREAFARQHPAEPFPSSPLRALGFASAGGAHARIDAMGRPASAFLKVAHPRGSVNVYDRKVVLVDEVHNLVRTETRYASQLSVLRERLFAAQDTVLAGFTGTPILCEVHEGRKLLDIIKGSSGIGVVDEGYLSSLAAKPAALFPRCLPADVPEVPLTPSVLKQLCHRICLHGEALQSYILKAQLPGLPAKRLQAYCNLHTFAGSYNDGKHSCKQFVIKNPDRCAPKFFALAQRVTEKREKTLVLVARGSGYRAALDLLQEAAAAASPAFAVASIEQMAEFNAADNLRGERFLCLVADTTQCGEGVSFRAVRQLHLLDVPTVPSTLVQQCGRTSRMLGHQGLPREEQCVQIHVYVAELPAWARQPLGAWCLRALARRGQAGPDTERRARGLLTRLQRSLKIKDLDALKARLERVGNNKARRLQRQHHSEGDGTALSVQSQHDSEAGGTLPSVSAMPGLERRLGKLRVVHLDSEDMAQLLCEFGLAKDGAKKKDSIGWRRLQFVFRRAIQELYTAESATSFASEVLALETADDMALRDLVDKFGSFTGALEDLRAQAVDKALLGDFVANTPAMNPTLSKHSVEVENPMQHFAPDSCTGPPKRRLHGKCAPGMATVIPLKSPAVSATLEAADCPSKRIRLNGKQPGHTSTSSNSEKTSDGSMDSVAREKDIGGHRNIGSSSQTNDNCIASKSPTTEAIESLSIQALKEELLRLYPDAKRKFRGVIEKSELQRLVHEGRKAGTRDTHTASERQHRSNLATGPLAKLSLLDSNNVPRSTEVQMEELRTWSVRALKDVVAALRPDIDLRAILEKDELCELIRPWISG